MAFDGKWHTYKAPCYVFIFIFVVKATGGQNSGYLSQHISTAFQRGNTDSVLCTLPNYSWFKGLLDFKLI